LSDKITYGLGLLENSALREDTNYEDGNRELLAITGSEEWQRIRRGYLGDIAN
jgi:hypothetical protein